MTSISKGMVLYQFLLKLDLSSYYLDEISHYRGRNITEQDLTDLVETYKHRAITNSFIFRGRFADLNNAHAKWEKLYSTLEERGYLK